MRWWVGGLWVLAAAPNVSAQEVNISVGNGFYSTCASPTKGWDVACAFYFRGLTDAAEAHLRRSCAPHTSTYQQRHDVTLKYLKEHPEKRHLWMPMIYLIAMGVAFCDEGVVVDMPEGAPP